MSTKKAPPNKNKPGGLQRELGRISLLGQSGWREKSAAILKRQSSLAEQWTARAEQTQETL